MGNCERCGMLLTGWQKRFCSKSCAGYRPIPTEKVCCSCRKTLPIGSFGTRKTGRPRGTCRACEAEYSRQLSASDVTTSRARKAEAERKRRSDPVIGPRLRSKQRHYHRFRGSTADDRLYAQVLKADPCSYCGGVATEVDHIVPTAVGGCDDWTNLTAACRSCNAQKNARLLIPWMGHRILDYEGGLR